ncbi:endonuclease/exonuclease/phosphatase family protein [Halalkalibacter urbisdiaboli]|uniref:endonuclease/exonuclease/phosphatase family protein n=1 Tax=Halalkalibacter urbisdiaboli TaxID=1960589 RepID=UPI000B4545C6|nr:endonuclease/exonuclease/phosphatase family protein [Halalkalibacter urbisdiaboli]
MFKRKHFFLSISSILVIIFLIHSEYKSTFTLYQHEKFLEDDKMITVTTYNMRYGRGLDNRVDLNRTIETLNSLNADIISLQEVERYSIRSQFIDQVTEIANALDMNVVFNPSLSFPGLYYGNAILSKFPINDTEIISFLTKRENRSALLSEIQVTSSQKIYVLNTHLGLNEDERLEAINVIRDQTETLDAPIILTGDLNALPDKEEYQEWNHFLTKSNLGIPIQTYYSENWQIDYIFHSCDFEVEEVTVLESEASDHFPVSAVLHLQAQSITDELVCHLN